MRPFIKLSTFLVVVVALGCAQVALDPMMSAAEGNDLTVGFSGCGSKASKGYLFCPKKSGSNPSESLQLIFPGVECKREFCTRFQFFRKDGSEGFGGALKAKESILGLDLSKLLPEGMVTDASDGEYLVAVKQYFIGDDGREYLSVAKGLVRVLVTNEKYQPMVCNDPNMAWSVQVSKKCTLQFTSSLRSVLCGECE